jgi:uncharacterized protein (TIGR00297 family)
LNYIIVIVLLAAGALASWKARKLTAGGAVAGAIVGVLVFAGSGYTGLMLLAAFFILGTGASAWKPHLKQKAGIGGELNGRTAGQVFANGGVAALLGFAIILFPAFEGQGRLMIGASLASATADTLASELGTVYGKRFYNILSFRRDKKGLDGVVSFEGFVAGVTGSAIIAAIYALGFGWSTSVFIIIISGTAGNLFDAVNFLNTVLDEAVAWLLWKL